MRYCRAAAAPAAADRAAANRVVIGLVVLPVPLCLLLPAYLQAR